MDPRLLRHYNTELAHLREMGAEFAQQFPKIAARLGMSGIDVADPYVERLLEGTAFLAARVQLKLEEEFPRFTQQLTHVVLPQAACPTPAMLIARLAPDLANPNLADGFTVPRHTALHSLRAPAQTTPCEFRTSAALTLWPIELADVRYLAQTPDLPLATLPATRGLAQHIKGALRIRLATPEGLSFDALRLDALSLYFAGGDEIAFKLHELVLGGTLAIVVSTPERPGKTLAVLPGEAVSPVGFADDEALLPVTPNAFQGYRLLHEYFALPQCFRFARMEGLADVLPKFDAAREIELTFLLGAGDASLERIVTKENVLLDCVPAINLFARHADRALVTDSSARFHVVPDRTHPLDFEVHSVTGVAGYGAHDDSEQIFHPFYADYLADRPGDAAYFTTEREPRLVPAARRKSGARTDYVGSETYVSIVDPRAAPYRGSLRQLSFDTLCSNRDLPLMMAPGGAGSDFSLDIAAPVAAVKCVNGPSRPAPAPLDAAQTWRLIDQLSLHYLSLCNGPREAAAALRALLMLHVAPADHTGRNQVAGVVAMDAKPVVRRLPMPGPIAFGRGLSIDVTVDDLAFQGGSAWLFGCVLDRFFARYVSINSFVQTVLRTGARGEILSLPARCGTRAIF